MSAHRSTVGVAGEARAECTPAIFHDLSTATVSVPPVLLLNRRRTGTARVHQESSPTFGRCRAQHESEIQTGERP